MYYTEESWSFKTEKHGRREKYMEKGNDIDVWENCLSQADQYTKILF